MTHDVALTRKAEIDIRRLDSAIARRVIAKLQWLAENVETIKHEVLTGSLQGLFKLRVGDYRVLYTWEAVNRRIVVHFIRHRREVYKWPAT